MINKNDGFAKPYGNKVVIQPCKNCFFERYDECILDRKCDYDVRYSSFLRCLIPIIKKRRKDNE